MKSVDVRDLLRDLPKGKQSFECNGLPADFVRPYSTDANVVLEVVGKLTTSNEYVSIEVYNLSAACRVLSYELDELRAIGHAGTPMLAVCRAALAAMAGGG